MRIFSPATVGSSPEGTDSYGTRGARPGGTLMHHFKTLVAVAFISTFSTTIAPAADRALLVGLDTYRDARVPKTPGGAEDARKLAATLRQRFGFDEAAIMVLTDEQATAERIISEFQSWLVDGTDFGDRVFFHYAGHGSQLKDDNGDEDDGWDETLAPYDVDPKTGEHQIRDDTLDSLIAQLSGRRAVLLFDSCHSGTMTRGLPKLTGFPRGGGARYLPRPDQFRELAPQGSGFGTRGAGGYSLAGAESGENVIDDPRKIGRLTGIVAISAAAPGQLAYPIKTEGGYRGALSYLFEEIVNDSDFSRGLLSNLKNKTIKTVGNTVEAGVVGAATGSNVGLGQTAQDLQTGVTVVGLETAIGAGMKRLQKNGKLEGQQEPWFEVISEYPIEQQSLFGDDLQAPAVALSNPISQLEIGIRTTADRTVFRRGENISFEVSTSRDGYLYLLIFSQNSRASCVYPNPDDTGNQIRAGTLVLPSTPRYAFPVEEPFGRDVVVALVSETRLPLCEKVYYSWDEVYQQVDLSSVHEALRKRSLRGIGVKSMAPTTGAAPMVEQESDAAAGWQAASLVLETQP